MILIFGGAYQGKLDYVCEQFNIMKDEVYTCGENSSALESFAAGPDVRESSGTSAQIAKTEKDKACTLGMPKGIRAIDHLERFVLACASEGKDALAYIKERPEIWDGRIVIAEDVSQGIVPMDATERAFREMNGRVLAYLASQADEVYRVFCGLSERLK